MTTESRALRLVLVSALLLSPRLAAADEDRAARAKQHFSQGRLEYRMANFDRALSHFREALRLRPRASVMLNVAQCYRQLNDPRKAIFYYKRYLDEWQRENPGDGPRSPFDAEVRGHITRLEASLEPPASQPAGAAPPDAAAQSDEPAVTPAPAPSPADPPPVPAAASDRGLLIAGWTLLGTGAALCLSGAVLGASAASKARELEQASDNQTPPDFSAYEDLERQGKALELGQIITLAVGGAALAAGAVLLVLHYNGGTAAEKQAWLAPSPLRGGALLSGGLAF